MLIYWGGARVSGIRAIPKQLSRSGRGRKGRVATVPARADAWNPAHALALGLQRSAGNRAVSSLGGAARFAAPSAGAVAPIVDRTLRSPGRPLDRAFRAEMEARFEDDFSRVRVHTDSNAVRSAWRLGARAYASGDDIVLGEGRNLSAASKGSGYWLTS